MNFRPQRAQKLIREELSKIVMREMEFPEALVTITEVEVDGKLENAKIKVSVIPPSLAEKVLESLEEKTGYLHHILFNKINLKPMPLIHFEIDRGHENAAAVEKLLIRDDNG